MRGGKWSHTEDTEYTEPCGAGFFSRRRLRRLAQMRTLLLRYHPDGKHKQSVCASAKVSVVSVRQIINQ